VSAAPPSTPPAAGPGGCSSGGGWPTGTLTAAAAVVGRGLAHAARHAVEGDLEGAATAALSAVTAPAVLAGAALADLVTDVFRGAAGLAEDALGGADAGQAGRAAA